MVDNLIEVISVAVMLHPLNQILMAVLLQPTYKLRNTGADPNLRRAISMVILIAEHLQDDLLTPTSYYEKSEDRI